MSKDVRSWWHWKFTKGKGNVCVILKAIDDTYYNSKVSAKLAEV